MALWNDLPTRFLQETFTPGEGVNTFRSPLHLNKGQSSAMHDFSSRKYPALKTRDGRTQVLPVLPDNIRKLHVTPKTLDSNGSSYSQYHALVANSFKTDWYYNDDLYDHDWRLVQSDLGNVFDFTYSMADWFNATTGEWEVYCVRHDATSNPVIAKYSADVAHAGAGAAVTVIAHATYPVVLGPMCSHQNRMFVSPENANGNLAWSKVYDPSVWTSPDGGITPIGSNAKIMVLISMRDRLFIGTNDGIYVAFGDADTLVVQTVTKTISIPNGHCACTNGDSVFFTDGNDVYSYGEGSGISNLTYGVFENQSISVHSMGTDGKRIYCSDATFSSSPVGYPDWFVYDLSIKKWYTEYGNKINDTGIYTCFANTSDNVLLTTQGGSNTVAPAIRKIDSTVNSDNFNQHNLLSSSGLTFDPALWGAIGGAESAPGGTYTVTGDGSAASIRTRQSFMTSTGGDEAVIGSTMARTTSAGCLSIELMVVDFDGTEHTLDTQADPVQNTWYGLNGATINVIAAGVAYLYIRASWINAATANGKTLQARYAVADCVTWSYGDDFYPYNYFSEITYNATSGYYFAHLNPTTTDLVFPIYEWESPALQIRSPAKKTLKNIWISADISSAISFVVKVSNGLDNSVYSTVYTMATAPTEAGVTKIRVPTNTIPKSEWVRIRVEGTGSITLLNVTLDWRVVERAN